MNGNPIQIYTGEARRQDERSVCSVRTGDP